jgi:hypothetical protein
MDPNPTQLIDGIRATVAGARWSAARASSVHAV